MYNSHNIYLQLFAIPALTPGRTSLLAHIPSIRTTHLTGGRNPSSGCGNYILDSDPPTKLPRRYFSRVHQYEAFGRLNRRTAKGLSDMPKQRQTCTRCSQRRQKCDRSKTGKAPCSRCVQNNEGHLCSTTWAGGYDPSVHRKYPRKSSPSASWPPSSEGSSHDTPPALQAAEQLRLPALTPGMFLHLACTQHW